MKYFYQRIRRKDICAVLKEKYYQDLEAMQEQYDVFLHDMKHTMRTIAALAETHDCDRIGHLIKNLRMELGNIEWKMICSHKILNALLVERKEYADDNGVIFNPDIKEPLYLQDIEDVDIITLIGNLLDNAIAAEKRAKSKEGVHCSMWMSREGRHVLIQVENSYEEKQGNKENSGELKARIGEKHGIGCKSMKKIVKKYGGIMESSKEGGRYRVKVILPVQGRWNENESGKEQNPVSESLKQQESQ